MTPGDGDAPLPPAPATSADAPGVPALAGEGTPSEPFDPTELLSRIWQQNLPLMQSRLLRLEQLAHAAALGSLTEALRTEGSDLAHKLAGSLGMFGYPRGTTISRELEYLFERGAPLPPEVAVRLVSELRAELKL